ncbi:MAG: hypothetical protein WCR72_02430 [Bacteroidota bacterium]
MKKILVLGLLSVAIWSGCSKYATTDTTYTPTCSGTVKSYRTDVAPIIQSYCAGCHSNFNTYSKLSGSRSSVRSMVVSGQMPQGTSLSSTQKDVIACWIDNGAPNN